MTGTDLKQLLAELETARHAAAEAERLRCEAVAGERRALAELEHYRTAAGQRLEELTAIKLENDRQLILIRAADYMALVCDDLVERKVIDARSALADARLNYGEPFKYHVLPGPKPERVSR